MTSDETLIVRILVRGDFQLTVHARMRMRERGIGHADIRNVGQTLIWLRRENDSKFRIKGLDIDGDDLTVIAAFDAELVIITLF